MRISRRWLIAGGGAAVGVAALGSRWRSDTRRKYIIEVLHKRLSYLKFDHPAAQQFASDYLSIDKGLSRAEGHRLAFIGATFSPVLAWLLGFGGRTGARILDKEERIAAAFLLSTDFFPAADTTREIAYQGLKDPYSAPCSNPFAHLA